MQPPEEKNFFQKYWMYIAAVLIALSTFPFMVFPPSHPLIVFQHFQVALQKRKGLDVRRDIRYRDSTSLLPCILGLCYVFFGHRDLYRIADCIVWFAHTPRINYFSAIAPSLRKIRSLGVVA